MTEAKPATDGHYSSCAVHNMPAYPTGPCDCGLEDRLRATIDAERAARLAAEAQVGVLTEVLRTVQWDVRGKCTACAGWNMSPFGETVKVHTADCPVAAALKEPANG